MHASASFVRPELLGLFVVPYSIPATAVGIEEQLYGPHIPARLLESHRACHHHLVHGSEEI
jgi:hypothetical protein